MIHPSNLIVDAENIENAVSQLVKTVDNCLNTYEKKWSQVLSLRALYYDNLDITNETCTHLFAAEIQQRSTTHIPTITSIPVNALGDNSIISCTLHVL